MADTAIRVTRAESGRRDRWRKYNVVLDGAIVGSLRRGDASDFPVEPGEHRVSMKIDWKGSEELLVTLRDGEVAEFLAEPRSPFKSGVDLLPRRVWINFRRV